MTHKPRKLKDNQRRSVPELYKNGELAVFYNLAYNRTSNFIKTIQRKDKAKELTEIRELFFPKHATSGNQKEKIDLNDLDTPLKVLTNRTYSELKVFFWNTPKGKNIRFVTPEEIKEINHILLLLLRLRDYHSHYWHGEIATYPTHTARLVLERTFKIAVNSYQPQVNFAIDVTPYESCWDKKNEDKLSTLGINFFLGFFLTRGQMELFMKSRQYLNRGGYAKPPTEKGYSGFKSQSYLRDASGNLKKHPDGKYRSSEDILDLEKSKFIASFYAQRDASESAGYWLGKHSLFPVDVLQYHLLQVRNYLGSVPVYLHEQLSEEQQTIIVCRTRQKPTNILATSIAYLTEEKTDISWRIYSDDVIRKKVSHAKEIKEDILKIPEAYFTTKAKYVQKLGITTIVADRLQHDTNEVATEEVQVQQELYENANRIMIKVAINNREYLHFIIGHENLKHWGALIGMSKVDKSIEALQNFAKDFMQWLQYLNNPSKKSFFLNNTYLQDFNGEKNTDGSCKHSSLLPKILLQLQNKDVSDAKDILRKRIQQKIARIINANNENHFAALVAKYNRADFCTGYFDKKEQQRLLTQINRIKNKIKAKKVTDKELAEKKRLEWQWKGKTNRPIRHEKIQLIYKAIYWILGKQGKFTSTEAKKQFAKFCYLLDDPRFKKSNMALIADWVNIACTAKQNIKKHENDAFEIYQKRVASIINEAISFDNFFKHITQLAIDKYKEELDKVATYDNYKNLIGLAKRLNIANPSNSIKSNTTEGDKKEDRRTEILAPFYKKDDEGTHGYVHLPHDFFLIATETKKALKKEFKIMPDTKKTLDKIKTTWKGLDNSENYRTYFADFKEINTQIKTAKDTGIKPKKLNSFSALKTNTNSLKNLKEQLKKIKQLYENLYTDTVLSLLEGRLLQNDARLPMQWKESHLQNIRKSVLEKKSNSVDEHTKPMLIKTYDGIKVHFHIKQLKSHDFYNVDRIKNIVKRLKVENPNKKDYEYKDIKTALQLHWKESIWFVSQLLAFEKENKKDIVINNDISLSDMGHASFNAFENDLGTHFKTLGNVRNTALHADILPPHQSYHQFITTIAGLKKQHKKRYTPNKR